MLARLDSARRLSHFAGTILQSNFGKLDRPFKLTFACTYRCNSRCQLCNIWQKPIKQELTAAEIDKFFAVNNYFSWIDLTGGEITLRRDLDEIIASIYTHCKNLYFFHFPTNCLSPIKVKQAAESTLKHQPAKFVITLSLDGDEELHDRLRGVKGNWARVMQTYELLKPLFAANFSVVFGVTVSQHNVKYLKKIVAAATKRFPELGWADFHFNLAHYSSHYYDNDASVASDKKVADATLAALQSFDQHKPAGWWLEPDKWLDAQYRNFAKEYYGQRKTPLPCKSLNSSIFLDSVGDCYACAMWSKKLFNIRQTNFNLTDYWHSDSADKVRDLISAKKCSNCWTPCEAYQTLLGNLPLVLLGKAA